MGYLRRYWHDLAKRRQVIMVLSGTFIAVAFLSGGLFGAQAIRDTFMILAAIVAGSDIAIRAFSGVRR
ncbi:MAG TPA: hypothetical protein VNZ58_00920, partial [Thermomicrobiales bacterium]|nr:hypothetical protein [Thermomicrobiales bacterium]